MNRRFCYFLCVALLSGCASAPAPTVSQSRGTQSPTAVSPNTAPTAPTATTALPSPLPAPVASLEPQSDHHSQSASPQLAATSCGPLDCLAFDSAEAAVLAVLDATHPTVLAVGEIHAQKDHPLAVSPTAYFDKLLPLFRSRSKHLILELWTGRNDCGDSRVEQVREAQKPVTSAQSGTNQNEFFHLGETAKAVGIMPHALVPSCEDYQRILNAKSEDIATMLELTASRTASVAQTLLTRKTPSDTTPFLLTYGGTMHNDVAPRPSLESFSFASELQTATQGHFVELDLVLPEQVRDTEAFRRFAWFPYFRRDSVSKHFALYKTQSNSFTLVYPQK